MSPLWSEHPLETTNAPFRFHRWLVGTIAIRGVNRIAGIKAVHRVEGIIRRGGLLKIQQIVTRILTSRIEDIVVAFVCLREALISEQGVVAMR